MSKNLGLCIVLGTSAALFTACGGQSLDVGSNTSGGTTAGVGGSGSPAAGGSGPVAPPGPAVPLPEWPSCDGAAGAAQETWTGYVQGDSNLPNDAAFTLSLQRSGEQTCGTLRFGAPVEPPPPATEPTAEYPPGVAASPIPFIQTGFDYRLLKAKQTGSRLKFEVTFAEPWDSWCVLQTPYPDVQRPSGYSCLPKDLGWTVGPEGCKLGETAAVSCTQAILCLGIQPYCQCDAAVCMASFDDAVLRADFDFDGDVAQGVINNQTTLLERASTAE